MKNTIESALREARYFAKDVRKYLFEIEKQRPLTEAEKELWNKTHDVHVHADYAGCLMQGTGEMPENILRRLREHIGLKPDDTSRDEEFAHYSKREIFDACCNWEGLINWSGTLLNWIEDIWEIEL